jgi:6-phospho-3-hexuloisomerase
MAPASMWTAASAPVERDTALPQPGTTLTDIYRAALDELAGVFARLDDTRVDAAVALIATSKRVALHGVGREGLQMRGFAMRLFHLGLEASVVGDMTCAAVGPGDLLLVSAGPGHFGTIAALMQVARGSGARTLVVTAQPQGACAMAADAVIHLPAQTMADDTTAARGGGTSVLPMGSLYEGALFVLFEVMVLRLRDQLGVSAEAMRARHTNLE